jgi:stearoyl-CoA desaturase (delta-9 desaturase)
MVSFPDFDNVDWQKTLLFYSLHVACLGVFWVGVSGTAIGLCAALYVIRMFAITGGYHRLFAHRSYRTSRGFRFVLGAIGCAALQRGPLWWASQHRHHHQHSDEDEDLHSPGLRGFWWSHVGWALSKQSNETRVELIQDLARYPEMRLLDRINLVPPALVAIGCFLVMGWQGVVWGFFISSVLVLHATFAINSLSHMFGTVRFKTTDASRNNLALAVLTLGEGWHNNHHRYAMSARQGFAWWEIDITYYLLKLLSLVGLIWDMKQLPAPVLDALHAKADRA